LFSGEFWTGERGVELGLADRVGEIKSVLRERYGKKVETPLVSPSTSWFSRKTPGVSFDGDWASTLISAMEARALWSRYGL
jgi:serine protease SohB